MRSSAAVDRRIGGDRFDGVTPRGPRSPSPAEVKAWFERRPCDLAVEAGGHPVALRQSAGPGLPVLLLHGAGASKEAFRRQFESSLAQSHRLVALDLPAAGWRTGADPGLAADVAVAATVAGRLELGRFAVLGWGRGAALALALATRDRSGVAGVVLTGAPLAPLDGMIARATAAGVPVASVRGAEDPTAAALPRGAALWRGREHVIPRAGHAPFLDSPDLFNPLLGLFLGEVARTG